MWVSAKLVTAMSLRSPVNLPRSRGAQRVAAVLDHDQFVAVGDLADAVPVGQVADQVRDQQRACPGSDHLLDALDVDVVGVGLDVHEGRHQPGADQRRHGGGEGQHRRDHFRAGRQAQDLDRQLERGRARVDHHPVRLAQQRRAALLHRGHVLAQKQRLAQGAVDGGDLGLAHHHADGVDLSQGVRTRRASLEDFGVDRGRGPRAGRFSPGASD